MEFDYDTAGPSFPGLTQPYSSGLTQPESMPTTLFGGSIPGVQFGPVTAIHAAAISALHGPLFRPVYEAGLARPTFVPGLVHAAVGSHLDLRG